MHYAYPGRKSSHPTSFTPRQSRSSILHTIRRRVRLRTLLTAALALGLLYLVLSWLFSSSSTEISSIPVAPVFTKAPSGEPNVVIVTVLDDEKGQVYNTAVKQNRQEYAEKHGYATFMPQATEYNVGDSPKSWAKVPALRHAMTVFPRTPFFLFLDDRTLIANPSLSVEEHLTNKQRIESLAITDIPVVPPDSVIRTTRDQPGDLVDLLLVQDREGLSVRSFVLRNGDWAKFFLDAWFDPLYRTYNFQKAERHALEHIVQWHGTILAKLALVPQHMLCAYSEKDKRAATDNGVYENGNFVISFAECDSPDRSCRDEMKPWFERLHGLEI
ncbi:uncharacterized protein PV09_02716 [Verruconis gallopava]|uniref:Uncharacterized protein n=1 Tax=Verruconis gallopava TaxID=253628 RepID=A0A0D1YZV8_9PEZI|nr:uncharacterized protein PV09_02716 [Verruconis gallopava]KIW06242.1 hypothetical protein PV09_02716 [Verruconis gallopava]